MDEIYSFKLRKIHENLLNKNPPKSANTHSKANRLNSTSNIIDILSILDILSHQTFCPIRPFVPQSQMFCPVEVLTPRHFVLQTFCLQMFCTQKLCPQTFCPCIKNTDQNYLIYPDFFCSALLSVVPTYIVTL